MNKSTRTGSTHGFLKLSVAPLQVEPKKKKFYTFGRVKTHGKTTKTIVNY